MIAPRSSEFAALLAACRPRQDPARLDILREAAASGLDGTRLLELARVHRVEGFLDEALTAAGIALPEAATLAARAAAARLQTLRNAAEEAALSAALAEAGIDALFLKGASIAMLAHETLALKASWDIDLLVARRDVGRAQQLLEARGYAPELPGGLTGARHVARHMAGKHDTEWRNPRSGLSVELHARLAVGPGLLRGIGTGSPRQRVALPGTGSVETLAPAPLLAYVAVHGTAHSWHRLKWLADAAALIARGDNRAEFLNEAAGRFGGGVSVAVMALLIEEYLGITAPPAMHTAIAQSRHGGWLLARSRHRLAAPLGEENAAFGEHLANLAVIPAQCEGVWSQLAAAWAVLGQPASARHLRTPRPLLQLLVLGEMAGKLLRRQFAPVARRRKCPADSARIS